MSEHHNYRPTEQGLYLTRTSGCGWYNLLIWVQGFSPYLHCVWWDRKEDKLGHGIYPLGVDESIMPIRLRGIGGEEI